MFTIVYKKSTGEVFNIIATSENTVLSDYETNVYAAMVVENVPACNNLRQYLVVENDQVVVRNRAFSQKQEIRVQVTELNNKIYELKDKLAATDYIAIKFAEGIISEIEYMATKNQRQAWRAEINSNETKIKRLSDFYDTLG